jgi:hypothetical protein
LTRNTVQGMRINGDAARREVEHSEERRNKR